MELGGKSLLIIADDADLDLAADIAMMANFTAPVRVAPTAPGCLSRRNRRRNSSTRSSSGWLRIRAGDLFADDTNFGPLVSFPIATTFCAISRAATRRRAPAVRRRGAERRRFR